MMKSNATSLLRLRHPPTSSLSKTTTYAALISSDSSHKSFGGPQITNL